MLTDDDAAAFCRQYKVKALPEIVSMLIDTERDHGLSMCHDVMRLIVEQETGQIQSEAEPTTTEVESHLPTTLELWKAEGQQEPHSDDNTYTIVENYILDHPEIGGREIAVYTLLARRAHMPKKTCRAGTASLARRLGWTRDTVIRAIHKLIELGLIQQHEQRVGCPNSYTLPHRHRSKPKAKGNGRGNGTRPHDQSL
jgi:hypothetical protein